MKRVFTAQEMRLVAEDLENYAGIYESVIASMLRQAADMMEQEKKYEYATKWNDGKIDGISPYKDEVTDSISFVKYISSISADDQTGCKLVRRSVGEWEEVSNEEG